MNTPHDDTSNELIELFLSDLRKDLEQLNSAFQSKDAIVYEDIGQTFSHIASCAKLARQYPVAKYAELLANAARNAAIHPEIQITVLKQLILGWESLSLLSKDALSFAEWNQKIDEWSDLLKTPTAEESMFSGAHPGDVQEPILVLFANELDSQAAELNNALLKLEHKRDDKFAFQAAMRAAHSIKGAAQIVSFSDIVQLAHAIEECFAAVQQQRLELGEREIEILFKSVDFLSAISKTPPAYMLQDIQESSEDIKSLCQELEGSHPNQSKPFKIQKSSRESERSKSHATSIVSPTIAQQRALRVTAETLNRLMGLAGEALVESRWMGSFSNALIKVKRGYANLIDVIDDIKISFEEKGSTLSLPEDLSAFIHQMSACQQQLIHCFTEFEMFSRRYTSISDRLYHEVIESRMRPFSDVTGGFPRMVRDVAKQLHKKVRLVVTGENTPVDREILEKLEGPLTHLLRNALDHGIELPHERARKGKPEEGTITLTAQHRSGMLAIDVFDDGSGIDPIRLRETILSKQLASQEMLDNLTLQELYDFMLLPGFSTAAAVTEISGRGIGLSSVQNFVHEVGGHIRLDTGKEEGFHISLTLPLTLSVIRALLVQIANEPYAFPLTKIHRVLWIENKEINFIEQRPYFSFSDENVGLVRASEVLGLKSEVKMSDHLFCVLLKDEINSYAVIVDHFMGEKELVVQELDPLLGKVPNISTGAFMEDGSPILILDVEDLMRSIDVLLSGGRLRTLGYSSVEETKGKKKRILVVDDSITVREVECRLLENQGYEVETAVNGIDGWNALRTAHYDLVVTDIDMPRMNGIEFVKAIRADPRFKDIPIMIVSYKEHEEDRMKGLDAGANYYLTKSSFHDETLVKAAKDLIGEPEGLTDED